MVVGGKNGTENREHVGKNETASKDIGLHSVVVMVGGIKLVGNAGVIITISGGWSRLILAMLRVIQRRLFTDGG